MKYLTATVILVFDNNIFSFRRAAAYNFVRRKKKVFQV